MKKLLFLLLLSSFAYGQVSNGTEQEFDTGIKNNAATTVLVPNYVTTQGADGTYGKIEPINLPITVAALERFKTIATAVTSSGLISRSDAIILQDISNTVLRVTPNENYFLFYKELQTGTIDTALKLFPQQDFPLANISGIVADGIYLKYVAYLQNGTLQFSDDSFSQDETYCQLGRIILKRVGGVTTFIDAFGTGNRNVKTIPDIAGYNDLLKLYAPLDSDVKVSPNANLTMRHDGGFLTGMSVNWTDANKNKKTILAQNPLQFVRLDPSLAVTIIPPTVVTNLDVTTYWNGSALVAIPSNVNATVQRILMSDSGNLVVQVGEFVYANFADAKAAFSVAPFTTILPVASYVEIGRIVAVKNTTNLSDETKCQFYVTASGGGGGGAAAGTDISVIPSPTNAVIASSTGLDGTLGLVDGVNAGLVSPTQFASKANDSDVVKLTGAQTIAGNKTFSNSIVGTSANFSGAFTVIDPVNPYNAATKNYVDGALSSKAPLTGGTGYIQNQNASAQSANIWISGAVKAGTAILSSNVTAASFIKSGATAGNILLAGGTDIPQSTFQPTITGLATNYVPKWNGSLFVNSSIFESGVGISFGGSTIFGGYEFLIPTFGNNTIYLGVKDGIQNPRAFISHQSTSGNQDVHFGSAFSSANRAANWVFESGKITVNDGVVATGTVTASPATVSTELVTKGQMDAADNLKAAISSPALTGTPTAPTAPIATNTTQIATTAFVQANSSSGAYTPTLTNTTNIASSSLTNATYTKIDNIVTVTIGFSFTPTAANISTVLTFTIPINRAVSTLLNVGSGAIFDEDVDKLCFVETVANTTQARAYFSPLSTNLQSGVVTFMYSTN